MARTQAVDYHERREAIVEKAANLFAASGFRGASVADLARACGISKALLYHYYPSKEAILRVVMVSHIDALIAALDGIEQSREPAQTRLAALTHAFMRLYAGAADRHIVLVNELDNLPAAARAEIVTKQRRLIAAVEQLIATITPSIASDRARLRTTAMLYFGMINWTHTWYDPAGPIGPDNIADIAQALIMGGLEGISHQPS
jgi:AcrR family transcriptional regulator